MRVDRRQVSLTWDVAAKDPADLDPTDNPDPPGLSLDQLIDQVVRQCGRTDRTNPAGRPSLSRRHGHQPDAARHVWECLTYRAGALTVLQLAALSGRHRSTVYRSIARGLLLLARLNPGRPFGD